MKTHIVGHHSGSSFRGDQYPSIYAYHNSGANGKWAPGLGCQYPYVIEKSGEIIKTQDEQATCFHAGNWLMNIVSIGICIAGDLRIEDLTEAQCRSWNILVRDIQKRLDIPDENILLHREVRLGGGTECPGKELRSYLFPPEPTIAQKLNIAQKALKWATGLRRKALERLVERLAKKQ